jgi:predicted metal-binding membrane protein
LHFLLGSRPGVRGALRTGFAHGGYCIGCCTGLMVALFALGIMSLVWMAVVAAAIVVEKVLPGGGGFARVLAVVLVAGGIWVATAPRSVPGLVQPDAPQMMMQP